MNRTRRAFDYQPPSYEEATKLTERRGGSKFDNWIRENGPRFFKPKAGDNFIRILPNTWVGSKHYALPIRLHRDIGPDRQAYLCLNENDFSPEKNCPICDERSSLVRRKADQKEVDDLRARTTSLIYLIDRSGEDQGPLIWSISNKSDLEILAQSLEKRAQRYLPIAHPVDGYDIEFFREGEGINTRYRGFKVARSTSPITDDADKMDEWLNYIEDNPLPDILQFYPAERIKLTFYGKAAPEEETRPSTIRETVREPVREAQSNSHDDPPFDTDSPPRRAPLETRPAPRDVEPPPVRQRARLDAPESSNTMDNLRARLQARKDSGA